LVKKKRKKKNAGKKKIWQKRRRRGRDKEKNPCRYEKGPYDREKKKERKTTRKKNMQVCAEVRKIGSKSKNQGA